MLPRSLAQAVLPPLAALVLACGIPVTTGPSQDGALCTTAEDCGSGNCVDGVCCDSACEGPCVSCAVEGSAGTCTDVPAGEDPRTQCGEGPCAGACDGAGACRYPGAEAPCGDALCAGDNIQRAACDGAGRCGIATTPCAPYACENGACLSACVDPLDCARTGTCRADGTCEAKLPPGSACASGAACASGYCADGVCCDEPCQGTCEACNLAGRAGTCTFVAAGEDPNLECPGSAPCGSSCDGAGKCAYAAAGTTCGAPACSARDAPVTLMQCNGAGTCAAVAATCGEYACAGDACKQTCGVDTDCRSTSFCQGSACVPRKAIGETCGGPTECLSGHCVDGVCCSSACGGACDSCGGATPGLCSPLGAGELPQLTCSTGQACGITPNCPSACSATAPCAPGYYCDAGTCRQVRTPGTACTADKECGSGYCDDGVCCATDCGNTPCKACNTTPQTLGQCLPLPLGEPSAQCPGNSACLADGQCASGPCSDDRDCKPQAYCAGAGGCIVRQTNGAACTRGRECQSGNCVDGVCCNTACTATCAACNLPTAPGTCTQLPEGADPFSECTGGLSCDGAGACNTGCGGSAPCEPGFVCQGGACVPGKPRGQACAAGAECATGFCADGVCCDTTCTGTCRACDLGGSQGTCTHLPVNTDPPPASCPGGYTCAANGSCQSACTTSAQCKSGYGCKSGACVLLKPNGQSCAAAGDCQSGACADGVCCNSACGQPCEACNVATSPGACVAFPPGTDPMAECGVNTCNGLSACGTTCQIDQDCAPGSFCNGGACAPKRAQGESCAGNSQCSSGACVDQVCCDSACTGECRSCALPGTVGTCTQVGAGTDPFAECAGGLACTGAGACHTTCSTAAQCEAAYFCQGGSCAPDLAIGQSCTAGDQCLSGNCVDGVCCNTGCGGACRSCNLGGSEGTCTVYGSHVDPENECTRTYCDGSGSCISPCVADGDCETGNYCDGSTLPASCQPRRPLGGACSQSNQCQSGICRDGVCCDAACNGTCESCSLASSAGTCTIVPAGTDPEAECNLSWCSGTRACLAVCGTESDCKSGNTCLGGACTPKKPQGATCTLAQECQSGFCADGRCCNSACGGACDECSTNPGTCTLRAGGSTGAPSCAPYECSGTSAVCPTSCTQQSQCVGGYYCNGSGQCVPEKANGTNCTSGFECTSGRCVDQVCCATACNNACQRCDVTRGTCTVASAGTDPDTECAPYLCSGSAACSNSCGASADCASGYFCNATSQCVAKRNLGQACSAAEQCSSGSCVDGRCCNTTCAGDCQACNLTGSVGTCASHPAGTDPDSDCGNYFCAGDGTCKNACDASNPCKATATCAGNGKCQ